MGLARLHGKRKRRVGLMAAATAAALASAVLAGCGDDSGKKLTHPPYTVNSVQLGFATAKDIGKGAVQFKDSDHGSHVIYTPPSSVPTCPYVQRADDTTVQVQPAVELVGGNPTGRFIVGPTNPQRSTLPVVTQGAVVFTTDALADQGMKTVLAEAAKCPGSFTVIGGPPVVVGDYKVNRRSFESAGWTGFAQQLAHTSPPDLNTGTYDDLVTIVAHKSNAVIYLGYAQIHKMGKRADSKEKIEKLMKVTLDRLG
ncbi:hypothetical protein [Actinomadura sp. HBU206391]|uniref:hypothetical protein n=1 Tax=Actinomadura sp. HBU206391 TaxID=2731692 RepID=UPI001650ACCE|nr:hypothetical protein [Actinomadura sp. HBU206391]MBC6459934.1 hypothetical protein [Actinomadura sp. HBU206391]